MKQYRVMIWVPKILLVNANSEEDIIKMVEQKVLEKPSDLYKIDIVEERDPNK